MGRDRKATRNLKKKISLIIEIYMDVKGKKKKEKLRLFIEEKVSEIISYRQSLRARKNRPEISEASRSSIGIKETLPATDLS